MLNDLIFLALGFVCGAIISATILCVMFWFKVSFRKVNNQINEAVSDADIETTTAAVVLDSMTDKELETVDKGEWAGFTKPLQEQ